MAVTALDLDAARLSRVHQNLQRLGLSAHTQVADAADVNAWWDGVSFDAILLDAPCSASGIVRRHPDIRWLRRTTDIAQLVALQARLLKALWTVLAPGGRMLYCTCSVFKAEGEFQIQAFLANHPLAQRLPSPGHIMPSIKLATEPSAACPLGDHDGFFYALLEKTT